MLSGVNELCKGCTQTCKQWKQIKIIRCPFYKPKERNGKAKARKDTKRD